MYAAYLWNKQGIIKGHPMWWSFWCLFIICRATGKDPCIILLCTGTHLSWQADRCTATHADVAGDGAMAGHAVPCWQGIFYLQVWVYGKDRYMSLEKIIFFMMRVSEKSCGCPIPGSLKARLHQWPGWKNRVHPQQVCWWYNLEWMSDTPEGCAVVQVRCGQVE